MTDRIGYPLGNYRLMRLLGQGGFAEVYLGEHVHLKSHAAVKLLHAMLKDEDRAVFLQEAQTLVRLSHPHIVRVLDFAVQDGTPFLVMEYAPNGTLRQRHPKGTRLSPEMIVSYVQQVASALQYAHDQHLVHRDVKPENMLLGPRDEILLSDFGLAVLAPQTHSHPYSTHEMAQQVAGTTPYLAPEQLQGQPRPASDQYALGVVVYEWLCGKPPFRGSLVEVAMQHASASPPSLREQVPDLAPAIEEVVLRALAKDPQQRFASVQEFAHALEEASREVLHHTHPVSSVQQEVALPSAQVQHDIASSSPKQAPVWKVPRTFTPLIGREEEVTSVCALLKQAEVRLLTLLGTGGIGKTRLSLQVATEMRQQFAEGVCFVGLAAISEPDLVIPTGAEALGIQASGGQPIVEQVQAFLRDKHLLLILDNLEQVLSAAPEVEALLAACPALHILVTSRAVLHVQAEHEFPVPPLSLPDLTQVPESGVYSQSAAMALFVQRVRAILPAFQITPANARAIAEVCVRLDGLPLAIELAAARIKLLPPQALLARLSQRFAVLTGGARTLPERQQTLRNTLQWSYDLLNADEQRLFRLLSVFVGGCTLEAVEAVNQRAGADTLDVLNTLASLMDNSLLQQTEQEGELSHFLMLETVREYGLECLHERGESEASQRAHVEYYLALAESADPLLHVGNQQATWLAALNREQENLRTALQYFVAHQEAEYALRLSVALWWYWHMRGNHREALRWLEAALHLPLAGVRTAARAKALSAAGILALSLSQRDPETAQAMIEESIALYQTLEDKRGLAFALMFLGQARESQHDFDRTRALKEQSVALSREVEDTLLLAITLNDLAVTVWLQGDSVAARALFEEDLALARKLGDDWGSTHPLAGLAEIALAQGDYNRAETLTQEGLAIAREVGDPYTLASNLLRLGTIARRQGDHAQAGAHLQECLTIAQEMGNQTVMMRVLIDLADIAQLQGAYAQAMTLVREGMRIVQEHGQQQHLPGFLYLLGDIRRRQGNDIQAEVHYREGLSLALKMHNEEAVGWCLLGLARGVKAAGQYWKAARLLGAVEARLQVNRDMDPGERREYERVVADLQTHLGQEAFLKAQAEGCVMTPEEALAAPEPTVVPILTPAAPQVTPLLKPLSKTTYPDELTAREVEVLRLVAQGWTDGQIAEYLVISPRTVNAHLTSIYRKIQVSSRSAATRYAIKHHVV
jgi:predicted ATPase/serine/threonine protein kinase/DNA-binding CsgD family transcriptional regulator